MSNIKHSLFFQKGVSLYLSVIILAVLLAMALGLGAILASQTRMIKGMGDSVAAFYGADTGVELVLYYDKACRQTDCNNLSFPLGFECNDETEADCDEGLKGNDVSGFVAGSASASYQVSFNDGATTIISIGMYAGTRRAIQVER